MMLITGADELETVIISSASGVRCLLFLDLSPWRTLRQTWRFWQWWFWFLNCGGAFHRGSSKAAELLSRGVVDTDPVTVGMITEQRRCSPLLLTIDGRELRHGIWWFPMNGDECRREYQLHKGKHGKEKKNKWLRDFGLQEIQKILALQLCIASLVIVTLCTSYSFSLPVSLSQAEVALPFVKYEITTPSTPFTISLARHLNSIGAKMYGAFWCSHCLEQKQMFGQEASKILNYVECFPDGYRKGIKIAKACADARIEGFPT